MNVDHYKRELNKVKTFCKHAHDGFLIAEINDVITKQKFINELSNDFEIFKINTFSSTILELPYRDEKKIYIVDVLGQDFQYMDHRQCALNININRDILSNLGCVIFICPTKLVNVLIGFSNSFWSFVAVHVKFCMKLDCFFSLSYIDEKNYLIIKKNGKNNFESSNEKVKNDIDFKNFLMSYKDVNPFKNLTKFLSKFWEFCNDEHIYYKRIKTLGEAFFLNRQFVDAENCYKSIIDKVQFDDVNLKLKIDILKALSSTYYYMGKYENSLYILERLVSLSEKQSDLFNLHENAIIWNNIGVLLYLIDFKNIDMVISCYNQSLKYINFEENEDLFLSEVLYNAAIVNYIWGDYNQSKYYIEFVTNSLNDSSRTHNIIHSRFSALNAFIMLNEGNFNNIVDTVSEALLFLRNELDEDSYCIMEVHYLFALIYLHLNIIDKASKCITKALLISKEIKLTSFQKKCIWSLYGIIKYFYGDMYEAKNYMSLAINTHSNENINLLSYIRALLDKNN